MNKKFGELISSIRKSKNLTQVQLGILSGMSRERISLIERGFLSVDIDTIDKISKALNCSIEIKIKIL